MRLFLAWPLFFPEASGSRPSSPSKFSGSTGIDLTVIYHTECTLGLIYLSVVWDLYHKRRWRTRYGSLLAGTRFSRWRPVGFGGTSGSFWRRWKRRPAGGAPGWKTTAFWGVLPPPTPSVSLLPPRPEVVAQPQTMPAGRCRWGHTVESKWKGISNGWRHFFKILQKHYHLPLLSFTWKPTYFFS